MKIPKFDETFIPILEVLSNEGAILSRVLAEKVRDKYYSGLPEELKMQRTNSGTNLILDRLGWGKSYLSMAKFVEYPKRGYVQITDKGRKVLVKGSLTLDELRADKDYIKRGELLGKREKSVVVSFHEEYIDENNTPQDLIESGYNRIQTILQNDLLEKLKNVDPYFFEHIVSRLLNKMGYGDFEVTKKSNDGGIDAIINEDKLGLQKIYVQAKRYKDNSIREPEIRNFIGAMSGDTSKGVFITTSDFANCAAQKAKDANHSIILINGAKLTQLMIEYNVGVQVKECYEIKELDNDFFEDN